MPQLATAGIVYLMNAGLSMATAQVIVYGSMVIATGYASVKIAEQKMREMEADARRKARNRAQEIQNMQFGTVAPRRFIYGEMVVNGHLIFQETAGTDNKDLYRVVYLGEGPINAATEIYFNEVEQTLSGDLDGAGASISSGSYSGYGTFRVGVNGNSGSSSSIVNLTANTSWTSNHKMTGNSWLAYKLVHNNEVWTQGIPQVRVKVQGRKIYDPRLDGGGVGGGSGSHRYDDDTTWAFSNNSALCVLDFLLNGMSVDPSDIDMAAMRAAADICDENVNIQLANGSNSTQARYTTNGVSFLNDEVIATLEQLLVPCHGTLVEEAGVLRLLVPKDSSSVVVGLTEDDIVSELNININSEVAGRINKVSGTFTDKDSDFQQTDFSPISSSSLIASDGREHLQQIDLAMITDEARAQRLASIVLKENSLTNTMELVLKPKFSYLKVMDVVTVTFEPEKLANVGTDSIITTATKWRISSYQLTPDGAVKISLEEYADSSYTWNTADHDYLTRSALADNFIDTITAPTLGTPSNQNFLDEAGNQVLAMRVPVTHGGHPNFTHTEIKLIKSRFNSSNVLQETNTFDTVNLSAAEGSVLFSGMSTVPPIGSSSGDYLRYSVGARTLVEGGKVSAEATISQSTIQSGGYIAKDTTAPPQPSAPTVTAGVKQLTISWDNYSRPSDFSEMQIFEEISGSVYLRGTSSGTSFVHTGLTQNTSHVYKIRAVDRVGNESAVSSTATGTVAADVQGPAGATGATGQSGLIISLNGADIPMNNITGNPPTDTGVDPRPNNSTTQAKLDEAFLAMNPLLSQMSDIPQNATVWARFVLTQTSVVGNSSAGQSSFSIFNGHTPDKSTRVIYDGEELISGDFQSAPVDSSGNSSSISLTNQFLNRFGLTQVPAGKRIEFFTIQASARSWDYSSQDWTDNAATFDSPVIFSPLVLSKEVVTEALQANEITANQLVINKDVDLLDGAAWRIGKTDYADEADGIFFGNPAGEGSTNFAFAFSVTSNSGTANEHGIEITPQQTKLIQPTITKQATGTVSIGDQQDTSNSPITIKSVTGNPNTEVRPNAQTLNVNAIGGGGGGAGADSQSGSAGAGTDTIYTLAVLNSSGFHIGQSPYSNITASGGLAGVGFGAAKTDGDAGTASARASGGNGGGANSAGGSGSFGSGGGGGGGRDYNFFTSSKKGGAGGGAGAHISNTYDISSATTVTLTINQIGAGGSGMASSRGAGGSGGTGVLYGTIDTEGLDPVILKTETEYNLGVIGDGQLYSSFSMSQNIVYTNNGPKPVYISVMEGTAGGGTGLLYARGSPTDSYEIVGRRVDNNQVEILGCAVIPVGGSFYKSNHGVNTCAVLGSLS